MQGIACQARSNQHVAGISRNSSNELKVSILKVILFISHTFAYISVSSRWCLWLKLES